jgi:hypothetical protein
MPGNNGGPGVNIIEVALADLSLTEADVQYGFKEVKVELQDGSKRTVRLSAIAPSLREALLRRYNTTQDARVLIRPMLAREIASDAFLDSLRPWSLAKVANAAVGILLGPQALRQLAERGAENFKREAAEGVTQSPTLNIE